MNTISEVAILACHETGDTTDSTAGINVLHVENPPHVPKVKRASAVLRDTARPFFKSSTLSQIRSTPVLASVLMLTVCYLIGQNAGDIIMEGDDILTYSNRRPHAPMRSSRYRKAKSLPTPTTHDRTFDDEFLMNVEANPGPTTKELTCRVCNAKIEPKNIVKHLKEMHPKESKPTRPAGKQREKDDVKVRQEEHKTLVDSSMSNWRDQSLAALDCLREMYCDLDPEDLDQVTKFRLMRNKVSSELALYNSKAEIPIKMPALSQLQKSEDIPVSVIIPAAVTPSDKDLLQALRDKRALDIDRESMSTPSPQKTTITGDVESETTHLSDIAMFVVCGVKDAIVSEALKLDEFVTSTFNEFWVGPHPVNDSPKGPSDLEMRFNMLWTSLDYSFREGLDMRVGDVTFFRFSAILFALAWICGISFWCFLPVFLFFALRLAFMQYLYKWVYKFLTVVCFGMFAIDVAEICSRLLLMPAEFIIVMNQGGMVTFSVYLTLMATLATAAAIGYVIAVFVEMFFKLELCLHFVGAYSVSADGRPDWSRDEIPGENCIHVFDPYINVKVLGVTCFWIPFPLFFDIHSTWKSNCLQFKRQHIHMAAWANALNQKTLLARNNALATHIEKAIRLIECNGKYSENYQRLRANGGSVFKDTARVACCILGAPVSQDYLHF